MRENHSIVQAVNCDSKEPSSFSRTHLGRIGNPILLVLAALFASGGPSGSAFAQTTWNGGGTADWYSAANWTAGVPNASVNAFVNGLPIAIVGGGVAETLDLSIAAAAEAQVNSGASLRIYGTSLSNNGTLTVYPHNTSGFDAYLEFRNPATTISGTGTIVMGPVAPVPGADTGFVTNLATNVVTQSAGHTIRGNGYIEANLANEGLVLADIAGRGLSLSANPKSNSGQIVAQNGGFIYANSPITQTGSGVIRASGVGSTAQVTSVTVTGGAWEGVDGGVAHTAGNPTLTDVTTNGTVHVISGNHVSVQDSLTNTGTITVNPGGGSNDATISFNSPAITLDGGGTIVLNPVGGGFASDAGINTSVGSNIVTNPADATIRGNGYINANIANAGLIACDIASRGLSLVGNPKSNSGQIVAENGGTIGSNVVITQTGSGVIRATGAGSIVQHGPGAIIGGTWEGVSGGVARTTGNMTLDGVTTNGTVHVISGNHVSVQNSLTNTGTITVNPGGGSNDATISFDSSAITLAGGGTIELCPVGGGFAADAGINSNVATNVVTNPADATIRGNGYINANIANAGLISCNLAGKGLSLVTNPKSNSGQIIAENGGVVGTNITITQTGSGVFRATGAGSVVQVGPGTLIGGTWEGVAGGLARTTGNVTLDGVTLVGDVHLQSGHSINASNGLTNNGMLTINPSGGSANASLSLSATMTVGGTGAIVLNGPASTNDANIFGNAGTTLTSGPNHTIAGRGQIIVAVTLQGTLSPGVGLGSVNRIEQITYPMTMSPTAVYEVDVNGLPAGQFDTLVGGAGTSIAVNGTVRVRLDPGFTPVSGNEFPIVTAPTRTGAFTAIDAPALSGDDVWRVRYSPNGASLSVSCEGDLNGDHVIDLPDLSTVLANFGTSSGATFATGDANGDGAVNLSDLSIVLSGFGAACP